jgi:cysteinyl-tRNA synthetase
VINGIKGGQVAATALAGETMLLLQTTWKTYMEDILGLQALQVQQTDKLDKVLTLLIEIRKDAKKRKDFATSDQIRNRLAEAGVVLKDEKNGEMSYTIE